MSKYKALSDWLNEYFQDWIYFNVTNIDEGNISLNSISSPKAVERYIDGSSKCELSFAVDLVKAYDTGTSDLNIDSMQECESLIKWCEDKNLNKELPVFTDCLVEEVTIKETPAIAVDTDNMLAKYQIIGKVTYLDTKGE